VALSPGTEAPDFTLKDQDMQDVTLSSFRGIKAVMLVFYPFTFAGVCQGELCTSRDDLNRYVSADVQVLACSCDSPFVQKKWAEEQRYNFPVLADNWPHGAVAQAYGVFNDALGCPNRATFLINKKGVIVDVIESENLGTARPQSGYDEALAKL
jgi:peroxiredoxin